MPITSIPVVASVMPGRLSPLLAQLEPVYDEFDMIPPIVIDIVAAIAVIVFAWVVGQGVVRYAGRPVARRFERPSVTRALLQVIRALVLMVGLAIAGLFVGITPGDLLISVTVFTAVLAVVLAPVARRFIGGMFVLADQPYEIGDMIEIADTDTRGFVEDVTLRYTKLFTMENTFIVVPNSSIIERDIVNYSAEDERTRQSLEIVITYEGDLDRAREKIKAATAEVDGVIPGGPAIRIGSTRYPAEPVCLIDEFGDNGIRLRLRYWVREPFFMPRIRSDVQEAIWSTLEEEPVEIAYPHRHLVFDETSGELDVGLDGNPIDE